ncbi:MAG: relaxase/mobilization nuclease domain-containing protein, partial [Candidatus Saccharimonadales bacterium]
MAALRSVVKHSYLTGKDKGVGRAQAHVRYIQFRGGKDKDEEPRSFFSGLRDDITGREVAAAVSDQNPRNTVMHKLILSPGVQGADVKEYCREVMADLGSRKGLDLEWYAVQHDNTNNPHVHIVVMGKDENGRNVRLTKDDYTKIKESGDRYLERNRLLDREEKDKDKDRDKEERNPVAKFVDALKAAAQEFARSMGRDEKDNKPESKFEKRKREKEE